MESSLLCYLANWVSLFCKLNQKKQYLRGRIGKNLFALVVQWIERKFPKL